MALTCLMREAVHLINAVRRRSGAGTRARRTGTDEPGRAEASGGRNRRRCRGCASRRRGPAGTGFRTRHRMPRLRSSACAASPGGRHSRSGRGSGGWTGSRLNVGRCSRTIPYRRMLLSIWRSFTAMPRVAAQPTKTFNPRPSTQNFQEPNMVPSSPTIRS